MSISAFPRQWRMLGGAAIIAMALSTAFGEQRGPRLVENVVRTAALDWDPDEEIEVLTAPVDQVYAWAHAGQISHSLVLDALLFFAPRWAELKAQQSQRIS